MHGMHGKKPAIRADDSAEKRSIRRSSFSL
jgi:hypothetical protein